MLLEENLEVRDDLLGSPKKKNLNKKIESEAILKIIWSIFLEAILSIITRISSI